MVNIPSSWELRLRRIVREVQGEALPDPHEAGLTPQQRDARREKRRVLLRDALCTFLAEVITADVVGKEVALATRSRYGRRSGSLREQLRSWSVRWVVCPAGVAPKSRVCVTAP